MKYLILIVVILLVIFVTKLLRAREGGSRDGAAGASRRSRGVGDGADRMMLACAQCGVHLPRDEALPGKGGVFCSEAHRAIYESRDHGG